MNLIFLDVDGVLNSTNHLIEVYNKTHKPHSQYSYPFDPNCLENLKTLVAETNASLVISSSWREDEEGREKLMATLREYELDNRVIGYTPILDGNRRKEIKEFLRNFKCDDSVNFIILDDDIKYMDDLFPYLVKTNNQVGLTKENVKQAIDKLTKSYIKVEEDLDFI